MSVDTLLDFIAKPESGGNFNIVYGGIKKQHRPNVPLTEMTIGEVLSWQDSIDPLYRSEAAGAFQIMEDTLRTLHVEAGLPKSALFSEENQRKLATQLLKRRGLDKYLAGKMTPEAFANELAKEWASLPVVSGPKKGRSYYAGDGLNKSHVSVEAFLAAVRSCREVHEPAKPLTRPVEHVKETPKSEHVKPKPLPVGGIAGAIAALVGLLAVWWGS